MALLSRYLRQYKALVALALVLATINQVFSLLDPLILRYVIDRYATRFQDYTNCRMPSSRISAAARRSASSRRSAPTSSG